MVGVVHSMSHAVGGTVQAHHGTLNFILLPYGMEYNMPVCMEKYAVLARVLHVSPKFKSTKKLAGLSVKVIRKWQKKLHKACGLPLGILSNGTPEMLDIAVKSAGMGSFEGKPLFDQVLSVDAVGQYKTAPAAYKLGIDALGMPAKEVLFVSSNGWDAIGATWFGYTSFWINRGCQPVEQLDVQPTATGRLLTDVLAYIKQSNHSL